MVKNEAFVFVKPHAVTPATKNLVRSVLAEKGIELTKQGTITGEEIDSKKLIDQHYYAIASKATLLKPKELNVPAEKFKAKFGLEWSDALSKGIVFNAADACTHLGIDSDKLDELWGKAKKAGQLIKFGGGFYCGYIESAGIYCFNAFFMSMRSKFVAPGCCIEYFLVQWDSSKLSWEDFRGKVLGPTDPADAPADSIRGAIYSKWQSLGLKSQPNTGDNGVHASASPFEALAERMNWLGVSAEQDNFGKALISAGVSVDTIKAWSVDPQVTYGPAPITTSLFDSLEDTDSAYCLALCTMIAPKATGTRRYLELAVALAAGAVLGAAISKKVSA
mmetsp:Transcript_7975/g.26503  ORF Transcript_7975/g.26503 Transcript_7975/m.26503 type:complete len:334 (-) Transcript_7975:60-1061(-)